MDITIDIEIMSSEVEVEISYEVYGKYLPATHFEPAEYPELEISSIKRVIAGQEIDISEMFTENEHEKIQGILQSYLDEGE